jgi:prevent-host-death family protein
MRQVSATDAKRSFGTLLDEVSQGPIAIERHGKVRAVLTSVHGPGSLGRDEPDTLQARHLARARQGLIEKDRQIRHQRIAIDLLTLPARARQRMVERAQGVVEHWRRERLCSQDYIDRWTSILALPHPEMAKALIDDSDGWGPALRQNSPWEGTAP